MIAIILVNWNGHLDTIECLESLLRQDYEPVKIIVVDNGSTDGSIAAITAWAKTADTGHPQGPPWAYLSHRQRRAADVVVRGADDRSALPHMAGRNRLTVTVIDAARNLGFAGGNNVGLAFALSDPEVTHVWFLNNDTVVMPNCLGALVHAQKMDPSIGFLGARLMYYHDPETVQALGGWFNPWICRGGHIGYGLHHKSLPTQKSIDANLDYVVGASIFVTAELMRQIGPMFEGYFLYFEELDLASRLPHSYRLSTCMNAVIYHKEGATIGTSGTGRPSDTSLYYLTVNQLRYIAKTHTWALPIAAARVIREYVKFALRRDKKALQIIGLASLDFLRGIVRTGQITKADK